MLISTRYENGKWIVDENAAIMVLEFRELLSDSKLAVNAMAFVAISCDPLSFLRKVYDDDDEVQKEAFRSVFGDGVKIGTFLNNVKVKAAVDKYRKMMNTKENKLRDQVKNGIVKMGEYIKSTSESLTDANIKDFMSVLKEAPTLIDGYGNLSKGVREETEATKKIVRGGRELTYREDKMRKKKK